MSRPVTTVCILISVLVAGASAFRADAQDRNISFRLDNGMEVVLIPLPTAKKTSLVVLYNIGNQQDPAGKSGMAHLAEHIYVTAGTENKASRTVQQYMSDYPDGWNAQTGDDYTVIASLFSPDRMPEELTDTADRMQQINVQQADLDRELPRMDSELRNMYEGFPMLAVANHGRHHSRLLPNDGRRGGKIGDLKTIKLEDIQQRLDHYYKPNNAMLVLAGAFDIDPTRKRVEETFGSIDAGKTTPTIVSPKPSRSPEGMYSIELEPVMDDQRPRVGITYVAPSHDDPLYAAFIVNVVKMQLRAMRKATKPQEIPFMYRPLDDPDFFYASTDVAEDETSQQAVERLEAMVQEIVALPLKPNHVATTKSQMALFLGTQSMPATIMAMNPYGVAFGEARRLQMQIQSEQLIKQLDALDQEKMDEAAEVLFGKKNQIVIEGKLK